jgi:hypothetical protein
VTLAGILLLGLGLRVTWLVSDPYPYAESGMTAHYGAMAQEIERGRGFMTEDSELAQLGRQQNAGHILIDPPAPTGRTSQDPLTLPGIPTLMAAVWRVTGDRYLPILILMILLDTVNVWLSYLAGRRLFGERVGLIAAGIYGMFPLAINFAHSVTDGTPSVTIVLLLLVVVAARGQGRQHWLRMAMLLGVVGGVGAYLRSNALLFAAAAALGPLPLLGWRRGLRAVGVTIGVAYAIFLPWVMRDAVELHAFLPEGRTGVGQTMYEGLSEQPSDVATLAQVRAAGVSAPYGSVAYDDYLRSRFTATLQTSPGSVISAFARHAEQAAVLTPRGDEGDALATLTRDMGFILAVVALMGAIVSSGQWRQWFPLLTVGLMVWASQIPFLTSQRFALSLLPVQAIFAARFLGRGRPEDSEG